MKLIDPAIEAYAAGHSSPVPELLAQLERETFATMDQPQMLTGALEGRFLKLLVQMLGARRALEVGTFTGNGALWMAQGLPADGEVLTCEANPEAIKFASRYFASSPHGRKIRILEGNAAETLKQLSPPFDFVFIDADKVGYAVYYEEGLRLLRPGGVMALDNMLREGAVLSSEPDEGTRAIDRLNKKIAADPRVEAVLLTVRDGIQLLRKK